MIAHKKIKKKKKKKKKKQPPPAVVNWFRSPNSIQLKTQKDRVLKFTLNVFDFLDILDIKIIS
ncbi:hypothetical protein CW304_11905 [Bacillus sp. UFRGS-B20]|nr:hypothetical protein CW304_11905 [Bacillus sp. UFRGS-B20]